MEEVTDFTVSPGDTPAVIARKLARSGGFTGRYFGEAAEVLASMLEDLECNIMLSFPASIVSTGVRGVVAQLTRDNLVDLIITTCGTLDHELARAFNPYYKGEFTLVDEELERSGFHRLGSVIIPKKAYGELIEEKMSDLLSRLYENGLRSVSSIDLSWEIGRVVGDENSILYWAYKNRIPVIVPGLVDGAVGYQLWLFTQSRKDFRIDLVKDENVLSDFVFTSKKLGALMLGGGISKHHTIWWAQFKGGLDYAIYVTTAVEYDGSLSGAHVREAVSWGKVKPKAKKVTVYGDATLVLPFLVSAALGIANDETILERKRTAAKRRERVLWRV